MKISPAESEVLDVLWRAARPIAAEEVTQALADEKAWGHPTVRSLLSRLVGKKAVSAKMEGRRYLYSPLIARADYTQAESEGLIDRLFDGQLVPFITQFASRKSLSAEEVAELRRLVEKLENDR